MICFRHISCIQYDGAGTSISLQTILIDFVFLFFELFLIRSIERNTHWVCVGEDDLREIVSHGQ